MNLKQKGMEKQTKKSISFVIKNEKGDILLVQRPPGDEDLPNLWGLPAGSMKPNEGWEDATRRAGKEKLGIQLNLEGVINEGKLNRGSYVLHMKLFRASIDQNETPKVPQPHPEVTQYKDWKWVTPVETIEHLKVTAPKGSLCCTLYLVYKEILNEKSIKEWGAELCQ